MKTETLKQAGYKYLMFNDETGLHTLYNVESGEFERWAASPYCANYSLRYKNTELEFCSSYNSVEKQQMLHYMRRVQNFGTQNPEFYSTLINVYRKYIA